MLLVGIQTAARTDRQGLTAEIFMVAMISQEASQSKVGRQEVTAFKVHPPSAAFVGKVVV